MGSQILDELVAEAEAMAKYALASGLKVPASVLGIIATAPEDLLVLSPSSASGEAGNLPSSTAKRSQVIKRISAAHSQLTHVVSPATPRTLLLLSREHEHSRLEFLGPVRLVRQMMLAAIILLAVFMVTALSPKVTDSSGDLFTSSGLTLLVNELFLLSAAGVGAAFTALFRANRYIAMGTYDPKYESSYWVRFILGLIAGIVLPALIPVEGGQALSRPLLALLGGFSASAVYRILARLVETLESFMQGDSRELLVLREQAQKMAAAEQRSQDQLRLAATLIKLRKQLDEGSGAEDLKASLADAINELVPEDDQDDATDDPPPVVEPTVPDRLR